MKSIRKLLTPSYRRKVELLYLLTRKEIVLKYKRTTLGILWSLLNPILTAIVFVVAFRIFMRYQMENYAFFLLSALFPWSWFQSSIIISGRSLVDNASLIKKVIFPRNYMVIAVIISQLIHFIFSIPILWVLTHFTSNGASPTWIAGVFILISVQLLFTYGCALIVSITNTFFRDIEYLVAALMNLIFWMTPIVYPLNSIPEKYRNIILLNPLTSLMNAWRTLFMENAIAWQDIGIGLTMSALFLAIGSLIFKNMERRLDEVI